MDAITPTSGLLLLFLASAAFFGFNWFRTRKKAEPKVELPVNEEPPAEQPQDDPPPPTEPQLNVEPNIQQATFDIAEGVQIRITVETMVSGAAEKSSEPVKLKLSAAPVVSTAYRRNIGDLLSDGYVWLRERFSTWPYSLAQTAFFGAIIIYLFTRLTYLTDYPIYFFTDEAIQTNLAADFLKDGFTNHGGEFLPTFFKNVDRYNLGISVYLQVIPYLLFGKSVFVTRAVSALITALGAWWVGLTLRDIFKLRLPWIGIFLLAVTPAWFLHSRTAFETVLMASFYAGFLYYYLAYRYLDPKKLYWALVLGALVFYSYSPGRLLIVLTGAVLFFSDLRYHIEQKHIALRGIGLLVLLALPFVRFQLAHPTANTDQLRYMGSYWLQKISLSEKIGKFWEEYTFGIGPFYWFFDTTRDFVRHVMGDYNHMLPVTFPFLIIGLFTSLIQFPKSSAHRAVIFAGLLAPVGGALVGVIITRVIVFIIPAVLLISLGIHATVEWLTRRGVQRLPMVVGLYALLAFGSLGLYRDALINGPTWTTDYGMGGMQYGAEQLFEAVDEFHRQDPSAEIIISPNWANGVNILGNFFFPNDQPFKIASIHSYLEWLQPIDENTVFVTIPSEYDLMFDSGKFTDITIDKTLPYPDGTPGFLFVRLRYVDNIEEIFDLEYQERSIPIEGQVEIEGEVVQVKHSLLDIGEIQSLFDGDQYTVTRTLEANPYLIDLTFPSPRTIGGIYAFTGSEDLELTVTLTLADSGDQVTYTYRYHGSEEAPDFEFLFPESHTVSAVRLEFMDLSGEIPAHVHIWEITFK